jgi:uracil-DNA glycosylase
MQTVRLAKPHDFEEWRAAARSLLMAGVPPAETKWEAGSPDLFAPPETRGRVTARAVGVVPKRFVDLARIALFHDDPQRFSLLYRLLFRLQKDKALLGARSDPDVSRLYRLVGEVRDEANRLKEARSVPIAPTIAPEAEMPEVAMAPRAARAGAA